jgi:ATP-dependent Clp protease ATP-binding subunit ClpB
VSAFLHYSCLNSSTNCANTTFFLDIADEIEKIIGDKIIGQRGPIRSVASAIRLRENGWVDPDRPLVMLFLGSSGIGKTELAKQVTYYLNSDESKDKTADSPSLTKIEESGAFVRIDMSEYQHSHTVSNLTGTLSAG